jgi:hypothetical protein
MGGVYVGMAVATKMADAGVAAMAIAETFLLAWERVSAVARIRMEVMMRTVET